MKWKLPQNVKCTKITMRYLIQNYYLKLFQCLSFSDSNFSTKIISPRFSAISLCEKRKAKKKKLNNITCFPKILLFYAEKMYQALFFTVNVHPKMSNGHG